MGLRYGGQAKFVFNVPGTASDVQRDNIAWRLNGLDATNLPGVYNGGSDTITFQASVSPLPMAVAKTTPSAPTTPTTLV